MSELPKILTAQLPTEPEPGAVVVTSNGLAWQRRVDADDAPRWNHPHDFNRWFPAGLYDQHRALSWPLLLALSGPVTLVHVPAATPPHHDQ
ncbi:hypothetical protein [Prauserella flavalba]|uniref:Uncharacterized protein n=1 Tax=Prauserella flavalba TaxID=1477506 RepID=A0A318LF63_9PSEU|nr:hypothetical protein [Prauserella flavalba]PXY17362.1 hypothetical protein BA062_37775 [Prauserella flavalba]